MKLTEFAWPNPSRPRWVKASGARIEGNLVEVAACAYGRVARVTVFPDQRVDEGELLVEVARHLRPSLEAHAPVSGRILSVNALPGEFVKTGQPLVTILESDYLWALAHFAAQDFMRLRLGQPATVRAGGQQFEANVVGFVGPADPVFLEFDDPAVRMLRPGMIASVSVAAG
jgi:multidrug resistance efflux pump